jgi:hypothetical protein
MAREIVQFQVLYRKFLGSMIDLELIAAQGDVTKLLGQFAGFLAFFSGGLAFGGMMFDTRRMDPSKAAATLWGMEHFLIATTMLVVGLFAVLSWDSTFPDRRDVLVLGPLPVRPRTLFLAKAASLGAALGITVVSLNIFSGFIWSLHFATGGFWSVPRAFFALWITVCAAGAFIFFLVLAAQGVAAQLLPRKIFIRVSPLIQIAAFCVFVGTYFLEPSLATPEALANQPAVAHLATYWFFAMFQQLNGGTHLAIAWRAWEGLAILAAIAALAYVLSYLRTLRKIVEQPDIAPAVRGFRWLPRFGKPLDTAVVRFSIRTIARSRQHRVVLAFFLAMGFAILILLLHAPAEHNELARAEVALLFANYAVLITTIIGIRAVFALPIALKANWIFRVTEGGTPRQYLAAIRRPLFVLGVAPVWIASACVFFSIWPSKRAAEHLAILALAGAIVAYLCLIGFRKIPFTCSFLPGKSRIHMAILGGPMLLLVVVSEATRAEAAALHHASSLPAILVTLVVAVIALRWFTTRATDEEVRFEESEAPAVLTLNLQYAVEKGNGSK